jgi:GTP-binding protein
MNNEIAFYRSVYALRDLPVTGLSEICISGRSNVGKSSLINRLANKKNLAKTSQKPGKTRSLNFYSVSDGFYLVDLPGYGYANAPKTERKLFGELVDPYLKDRKQVMGIIQLLDARHGPVAGDYDMLNWIKGWGGNALYVFTKADKATSQERAQLQKTFEKEFGAGNSALFSARTGKGTDVIWSWIEHTLGISRGKR